MKVASSYGFNASAVAFGGVIKAPRAKKSKPIRGIASVALAPAGGIGESFTKRFNEDGIRFRNALSRVEGSIDGDTYVTTATVSLEKLDIFGRVKCEGMEAVITSRRTGGDPDSAFTIKASFDALRIDDGNVKPPLNVTLFRKVPTYRQFVEFFSDEKNMLQFAPAFGWLGEGEKPDMKMIAMARTDPALLTDPIRCSLLTSRIDADTAFRQDGYTLLLDGFGKIHIAEVLVKPSLRRINMLRLEVRKPGDIRTGGKALLAARGGSTGDEYTATVASGEGNGSQTFPP